jgi:beta-glucosidase
MLLSFLALATLGAYLSSPGAMIPVASLADVEMMRKLASSRPRDSARIAWIGDSITAYWLREGRETWDREFAARSINLGVEGDRVENTLWLVTHGALDGVRPDGIVLLIGTNNLNWNSQAAIADGVGTVVGEIRSRYPATRVLVLGLLPRGPKWIEHERRDIIAINRRLAALEDGRHVRFLDAGGAFLDASGRIRADLLPDVHLSAEGYRALADLLRAAIGPLIVRN